MRIPLTDSRANDGRSVLAYSSIEPYAGGSPLFALETVKHLRETDQLERGFPQKFPPPGRVNTVLSVRLERLGAGALQLARALAVLGNDFTLELAAEVVDLGPGQVMDAWEELDAAQIARDRGFTHDLLAEAVSSAIPGPIRTLLHRRAAEALSTRGGAPGAIAAHWSFAGDAHRAAASAAVAAAAARIAMLDNEAAGYGEQLRAPAT